MIDRPIHGGCWLGIVGFGGIYGLLSLGSLVPYPLIHDGLLMPLFGCLILGLSGRKSAGARLLGTSHWCLWARPATVFTCCTSICGT